MSSPSQLICQAILEKRCLEFYYRGQIRIVEPHILGTDKHRNVLLSAYFVGGFSRSAGSPYWRTYRLAEIRELKKSRVKFDRPREGYNPNDPKISKIFCRIEQNA